MISITCCYAVVNLETFFNIQGLQVNIAHEIDSMQLLGWVEWMRDERSFLYLQRSRQRPQVQMRAVFVALILKFQSVISATEQVYFDLKGLELKPSRPFENVSWCWTGSTNWKIFLWTLALNTNPPRQEADRRSKSKHSEILLKSM